MNNTLLKLKTTHSLVVGFVLASFAVVNVAQAVGTNHDNELVDESVSGEYSNSIYGSYSPENYTYNGASDAALFETYGMRVKIWPEITASGASFAVFDYWNFSSNCGSTDATNTCIYYDYTYENRRVSDVDAYFKLGKLDATQTAYQQTSTNTGNFTKARSSKPVVLTYQYKLLSDDTTKNADTATVTVEDVDTGKVYYQKQYSNRDIRTEWKTVKVTLPAKAMTKQLKFTINVENDSSKLTKFYIQKASVAQYEKPVIGGEISMYTDDSDTVADTVVELTNQSGSQIFRDKTLTDDGEFSFKNLKRERGYGIQVTTPAGRTYFRKIPKMQTRTDNIRSFQLAFY